MALTKRPRQPPRRSASRQVRKTHEDVMEFQSSNFRELCRTFSAIDLFGRDRSAFRPLGHRSEIVKAFETGAAYLPIAYRRAYVQFARDAIPSMLIRVKEIDRSQRYHYLERLLAPVFAHGPPYASHDIRPQLRRF